MFNFIVFKNKGVGLIEVIIGLAVISTSFFAVFSVYNFFMRAAVQSADSTKATFLLEEGMEVVRSLRDVSWSGFYNLSTSTDHYILFDGNSWATTTSDVYVDGKFERRFVVSDVFRDADGDISTIGTLDTGIRRVDVFVSWLIAGATSTLSAKTYLANLYE